MLSSRGSHYASLGLADGYLKERGELYDKRKSPNGLISLADAENYLMHEDLLHYVKTKCAPELDSSSLSYGKPFGTRALCESMSGFIDREFRPVNAIRPENIIFAAGVTAINEICALSLTDPGDGILLGMPIYGSFYKDLQTKSSCHLVYTPFHGIDQFTPGAVEKYKLALQEAQKNGIRVRALVISNPHNPLGRCYPPETLRALLEFCGQFGLHLISDEIYALSVYETNYEATHFTSILSLDPTGLIDPKQVHVLYGTSKDFSAAGLRLGCVITRNEEFTKSIQSLSRFSCPSPLCCAVGAKLLGDREFHEPFLQKSRDFLGKHHSLATQTFDQAGIAYSRGSNAGYFLWIDLSACLKPNSDKSADLWSAEKQLAEQLFSAGLEMASGSAYHSEQPGWFRFLFSVNREVLEEASARTVRFYNRHRPNTSTAKSEKVTTARILAQVKVNLAAVFVRHFNIPPRQSSLKLPVAPDGGQENRDEVGLQVLVHGRTTTAPDADLREEASNMLESAKMELQESQREEDFVYANTSGFELLEAKDSLENELRQLRTLPERMKHLEEQVKDNNLEIKRLKDASVGYQDIRNRFLSVYCRDIRAKLYNQSHIRDGNQAAHNGDLVADARLYLSNIRTDDHIFYDLYGITPTFATYLSDAEASDYIRKINERATYQSKRDLAVSDDVRRRWDESFRTFTMTLQSSKERLADQLVMNAYAKFCVEQNLVEHQHKQASLASKAVPTSMT